MFKSLTTYCIMSRISRFVQQSHLERNLTNFVNTQRSRSHNEVLSIRRFERPLIQYFYGKDSFQSPACRSYRPKRQESIPPPFDINFINLPTSTDEKALQELDNGVSRIAHPFEEDSPVKGEFKLLSLHCCPSFL